MKVKIGNFERSIGWVWGDTDCETCTKQRRCNYLGKCVFPDSIIGISFFGIRFIFQTIRREVV